MFVRICVLLLSLVLASCQTGPLVNFAIDTGINGAASLLHPNQSYSTQSRDTKIHSQSPLVCTKEGEECKVMKQIHADKLNLAKTCNPVDETDFWYYEKPNT